MQISIVYVVLLILMLFVLYVAGRSISGQEEMSSVGYRIACLAYTLNEGLRFGRGIDYNEYWRVYEELASGVDSDRDFLFVVFMKFLINIGIPYQGFILLASFMFFLGVIMILRHYKEILPFSLPLFALFSL